MPFRDGPCFSLLSLRFVARRRFSWKENQINNDVSAELSVGRHTLSRRFSHRKGVQGNHRRGGFPEWGVGRASALPFEALAVPSPESVKTTGVFTPLGRVWVGTNSVGWRIPGWVRQPNIDIGLVKLERQHSTYKNFWILGRNFCWKAGSFSRTQWAYYSCCVCIPTCRGCRPTPFDDQTRDNTSLSPKATEYYIPFTL